MKVINPLFDQNKKCRYCWGTGFDSLELICCPEHNLKFCKVCRGTGFGLFPVPDNNTRYTRAYITYAHWHAELTQRYRDENFSMRQFIAEHRRNMLRDQNETKIEEIRL